MDTIEKLIELKKLGLRNCEIARELNLSKQYVSRVCRSQGYGRETLTIAQYSTKSPDKRLLTTMAASCILGVCVGTIRRWSNDGKLPCFRIDIGRKDRRFYQSDIEALIKRVKTNS